MLCFGLLWLTLLLSASRTRWLHSVHNLQFVSSTYRQKSTRRRNWVQFGPKGTKERRKRETPTRLRRHSANCAHLLAPVRAGLGALRAPLQLARVVGWRPQRARSTSLGAWLGDRHATALRVCQQPTAGDADKTQCRPRVSLARVKAKASRKRKFGSTPTSGNERKWVKLRLGDPFEAEAEVAVQPNSASEASFGCRVAIQS